LEEFVKRTDLELAITQLASLLRKNETREAKYQEFFEKNPIVFEALGYVRAYSRPRLQKVDGDYLEPDFLVQQVDGLYQIFELKTPRDKLINEIKNRDKLSASIDKYISQVAVYSEYFDDSLHRQWVKDSLSLDIQKQPDMVLVVGVDENTDKKLLHLLVKRRTGALHVVTYTDILTRLQFQHAALYGSLDTQSGVSWHGIITLHDVDINRPQYYFDAGNSVNHSRWSLYLNARKHLCFEIIDKDGVSHSLSVPVGKGKGIDWEAQAYVCCEFGNSDRFSIMQMLIDNRIVARNESPFPIQVPAGLDFHRHTIGADIEGKNHGTMTMAGLLIYEEVLPFQKRYAIAEAIFDQFFTLPSLAQLSAKLSSPKHLPNTKAYLMIGETGKLED
jgi:hypothetical protein